jgi:hypothetical protein
MKGTGALWAITVPTERSAIFCDKGSANSKEVSLSELPVALFFDDLSIRGHAQRAANEPS